MSHETIEAGQFLYGKPPAGLTPQGSMYQTIFYTREFLDRNEVVELEARLLCEMKSGAKHVYFHTASGRAVAGRIAALDGVDAHDRGGLYLAHALILEPLAFSRLGNDPFVCFEHFPFHDRMEEAVRAGDLTRGEVGKVELPVPASGACDEAPPAAIQRALPSLILLATHARDLASKTSAVGLLGSADRAYETLRALFRTLPPALRRRLSFDTGFTGGSLSRLPYWSIGLPEIDRGRSENLTVLDLRTGALADGKSVLPRGAFGAWVAEEWEARSWSPGQVATAYHLGEWLDDPVNGLNGKAEEVTRMAFRSFFRPRQNRARLEARVVHWLRAQVGTVLARRIELRASAWVAGKAEAREGLRALVDGFSAAQLSTWLSDALLASPQNAPGADEVGELDRFLQANWKNDGVDERLLLLECLYRRFTQEWEPLRVALTDLPLEAYERFARWAARTVKLAVSWRNRVEGGDLALGPIVATAPGSAERSLLLALLGCSDPTRQTQGARATRLRALFGGGSRLQIPRLAPDRRLFLVRLFDSLTPDGKQEGTP